MTYKQTLEYLYTQLPMFQRTGATAYKANLDNTIAICKFLKNPQDKFKSIHISGTNGKGSTSHMLAAIFQTAGYKTGLFTSPHLKDFRERIRINGKKIPQKFVVDFVEKYKTDFERIQPSFFEMTIGLAFDYFEKEKIDIAILETGLGGRLDSTNIVTPELSLITNIGLDHMDILGDTIEKIAAEKAGIIKKKIPVVISEKHKKTVPVFEAKAKEENAPIYYAEDQFKISSSKQEGNLLSVRVTSSAKKIIDLQLDLTGKYQLKNLSGVLTALEILNKKGFDLPDSKVKSALKNVKKKTGILGRWQTLSENPLTICDTGHNEDGISEVLSMIDATPHKQLHFVLGVVKDKDISKILNMLPKEAIYYFCKASIPRALDQNELASLAQKKGLKGKAYSSVEEALLNARKNAKNKDLVFVGGSTFVVAEVV